MCTEKIFTLLPEVSRTFALSIRALRPGTELANDVALAYLLCRLLDTIEDDAALPAKKRAAILSALGRALADAAHTKDALARASSL